MGKIEMPQGWSNTNLGNIINVIRGVTYKKEDATTLKVDGYLPIFRANNIQDSKLKFENFIFVREDLIKPHQKIKKNDVLVAMSSGSKNLVGKSARSSDNLDAGFGAFCAILRPIKYIYPETVNLFTQTAEYRGLISQLSAGANINNLKPTHFDEIPIWLPPFAEQKEIVRIIESHLKLVDQIKSRLDALPKILEQFRQSVLASAVSGGLTGIEVKGVRVLEDYVSIENGARKPVSAAIRKGIQGEIPYIGATGVIDYLNDRTHVGRYLLVGEDGANLLTKTKDLAFIFDGEMWVNNHAHVLKEKEGVDLDFIKIVINAMDLKPWVTGSAQPKLTQRALRALPIPYYLESEQKEIVKRVEILFTLADQIESKTKNAQERVNLLTQSILAKAFRGEFTAKWREENPDLISGENSAEALLKRIEEAKKAAKKKK